MWCHRGRRATPQARRNPLSPSGLRAAWGHLRRCRSSTMSPHRLRCGAWHLAPRHSQRGPRDFYHGLLRPPPSLKHQYLAPRAPPRFAM